MRPRVFLLLALATSTFAAATENGNLGNLLETARIEYQTGQLDSALTKLEQHDKAKGATGESLDLRGAIALEQGKFAPAEQAFTEAHKMSPALFAPRLHLGDLYLRQKQYAKAREIYEALARETNILSSSERLRYGLLLVALASQEDAAATKAWANIKFPTETPAYYFAQAASDFAHGRERSAEKWIATARKIFPPESLRRLFVPPFGD